MLRRGQGHYVPQLAQMIVDGNNEPGAFKLDLQGFMLGALGCAALALHSVCELAHVVLELCRILH